MDEDCHDKLHNYIPKPLENAQENTCKDNAVACESKCSNDSTDTNKSWLDIDDNHLIFGFAVAGAAFVSWLIQRCAIYFLNPSPNKCGYTELGTASILIILSGVLASICESKYRLVEYIAFAFTIANIMMVAISVFQKIFD